MEETKLKSCPFCGGNPYTNYGPENGDTYGESWDGWTIGCVKCGANIFIQDDTIGKKDMVLLNAIKAWNTRTIGA